MTFASLFTGIGGFDRGLERAGMQCVLQVEKNKQCLGVLRQAVIEAATEAGR